MNDDKITHLQALKELKYGIIWNKITFTITLIGLINVIFTLVKLILYFFFDGSFSYLIPIFLGVNIILLILSAFLTAYYDERQKYIENELDLLETNTHKNETTNRTESNMPEN